MTIKQVKENSGLSIEVAESLYWKCLWLRDASENKKVQWARLLKDKKYRCMKHASLNKH